MTPSLETKLPVSQVHPWELQNYPRAPAFALALGKHPATVFTGNCAHDEKTEASSLYMAQRAIGNAIKAFEDALQLFRRNSYPPVADAQRDPFLIRSIEAHRDVHLIAGILHRVVEHIRNRCAQLFGIA
jgi:hypothetical protein